MHLIHFRSSPNAVVIFYDQQSQKSSLSLIQTCLQSFFKKNAKFYAPCFAFKFSKIRKLWQIIWDRSSCVTRSVLIFKSVDKYVANKSCYSAYYRNSLQRCFIKKTVLKNFVIFTGKHLCWSLFLLRLQVFRTNFYEHIFWRTSANGCFYYYWCRKSYCGMNLCENMFFQENDICLLSTNNSLSLNWKQLPLWWTSFHFEFYVRDFPGSNYWTWSVALRNFYTLCLK